MPRRRFNRFSSDKEQDLQKVYQFICNYAQERNLPPTQREIAEGTYISRTTIVRYLDILAERGKIAREDGLARGVWVIVDDEPPVTPEQP